MGVHHASTIFIIDRPKLVSRRRIELFRSSSFIEHMESAKSIHRMGCNLGRLVMVHMVIMCAALKSRRRGRERHLQSESLSVHKKIKCTFSSNHF